MSTNFQAKQLAEIHEERREALAKFQSTGAIAEIGVVSNTPGTFTVNTLNGPRKRNFENQPFPSEIEAVRTFARQYTFSGKLRRNGAGRYLVFP